MIQDIAPHVLHNEYKPVPPRDGDYVFIYDGNNILMKSNEEFYHYEDLPHDLNFIFLFTIDDKSC